MKVLNNTSLKNLIDILIKDEKLKKEYLEILPSLSLKGRLELLKILFDVYLLEKEKEETKKKIKEFFEK